MGFLDSIKERLRGGADEDYYEDDYYDDYEVSEELAARFAAEFGPSVVPTPRHLDLTAAVVSALASAGVDEKRVAVCDVSTASATDWFFSYRAESGETGRHGAIALMGAGEATL